MILYLIIAIGLFAVVSGIGRLVLLTRAYFREEEDSKYDRERALGLSIMSVTAIIAGTILVLVGLLLKGIFIV